MSVTNSNDELDADRDGGAPDNSAQSAPSPNETDVNEVEPTEDAVLPGDAVSTDTPASTEDAEPSDTSDLDDDFEPASGTALSDDPVLNSDPDLPNDDAPAPPSTQEPARASAEFDDHQAAEHGTESHDRNWVGYAAFATGALALSVVAIVLGHLGLKASKQGRAANRDFALAGLILGYIGLVATAVGVWFWLSEPTSPANIDVQAQQDVSAVGAAAAAAAIESGEVPTATLTDTGYLVAGEPVEAHLAGERTLTLTGETFSDWCLDIAYDGGEQPAFSYSATTGMAQGRCGG